MHRTTKLVSALGALAIVVAACGGGASPTPAASTPAESTAPAESAAPSEAAYPTGDFKLLYWTKEGGDSLKFVESQAAEYTALHPNVTFEIVNKDVEVLREDFQTASLAGEGPDILGTVADHVGVFTAADLIQPLDDIVDKGSYVPAAWAIVTADGKLWGAPISFGNQLMLYWNKALTGDAAPADSDAWIAKAKELTTGDKVGITFNQTESFWLVPFLGGYGGTVFAADGITPTLNTDPMKSALQFLYDLSTRTRSPRPRPTTTSPTPSSRTARRHTSSTATGRSAPTPPRRMPRAPAWATTWASGRSRCSSATTTPSRTSPAPSS